MTINAITTNAAERWATATTAPAAGAATRGLGDGEIAAATHKMGGTFAAAYAEIGAAKEAREERSFWDNLGGIFLGPLIGTAIGAAVGDPANDETAAAEHRKSAGTRLIGDDD